MRPIRGRPIRGLVFDKDGTLFDFHATWSAWCDGFIRDLCGPDPGRVERLARRLDFDLDAGRFQPSSPMIAGTMEVIVEAVREVVPEREEGALRHLILTTSAAARQIEVTPLVPLIDRLVAAGMTLGIATNPESYVLRRDYNGQEAILWGTLLHRQLAVEAGVSEAAYLREVRQQFEVDHRLNIRAFLWRGDRPHYLIDPAAPVGDPDKADNVDTDPAVKAGRFVYEIVPWWGPASLRY